MSNAPPPDDQLRFGLFLNMGANLAAEPDDVFAITLRQAELADRLGYHDLWVTEHHFIPFGLNPSALSAASFLLGRTANVRVGTAVALTPLHHPVALAEQSALLARMSGGRFDLGIGRGGYVRDYEVFGVDTGRWGIEPEATIDVLARARAGETLSASTPWFAFDDVSINPPMPDSGLGLFAATRSDGGIAVAAARGLPLLHYFAVPAEVRRVHEQRHAEARCPSQPEPRHVHTLIVLVTDDPDTTRKRLADSLLDLFIAGDWPKVPQASAGESRTAASRATRVELAQSVAANALIGRPEPLADEVAGYLEATGARHLVMFMEPIADPELTLRSIERFATEVAPRVRELIR
ncbi:MAG: LLM class flavin-dependent oxidoreductase [Actinomycetota bacterium]